MQKKELQDVHYRLSRSSYLIKKDKTTICLNFNHTDMRPFSLKPTYLLQSYLLIVAAAIILEACNTSSGNPVNAVQPPPTLPVITVSSMPATVSQEFSASLQGTRDIEIRPQVDGYLDKIYVDEGAYVKKGQSLFHIDSRPYVEQLNTAKAGLAAANANLANAQINVSKIAPLVQNNVVSEVN